MKCSAEDLKYEMALQITSTPNHIMSEINKKKAFLKKYPNDIAIYKNAQKKSKEMWKLIKIFSK